MDVQLDITCDELVVVTGPASAPPQIELRSMTTLERPAINTAYLPAHANSLLHNTFIQHVTVFHSGKVSDDAANLFEERDMDPAMYWLWSNLDDIFPALKWTMYGTSHCRDVDHAIVALHLAPSGWIWQDKRADT